MHCLLCTLYYVVKGRQNCGKTRIFLFCKAFNLNLLMLFLSPIQMFVTFYLSISPVVNPIRLEFGYLPVFPLPDSHGTRFSQMF